jgi:arsenite-transporting ATPase
MFRQEVVGLERLAEVAEKLYGDEDPVRSELTGPPFTFSKEGQTYTLSVKLPFVEERDIKLNRTENDLIINLGAFRRHVPLPQSLLRLSILGAEMQEGTLTVQFS